MKSLNLPGVGLPPGLSMSSQAPPCTANRPRAGLVSRYSEKGLTVCGLWLPWNVLEEPFARDTRGVGGPYPYVAYTTHCMVKSKNSQKVSDQVRDTVAIYSAPGLSKGHVCGRNCAASSHLSLLLRKTSWLNFFAHIGCDPRARRVNLLALRY